MEGLLEVPLPLAREVTIFSRHTKAKSISHLLCKEVLDHETSPVPRVPTKEKEPRNCNSCLSIMLIDHQVQREKNSVMTSPKNQDHATEMEPG
jgi:hypothetical protein